MLKKIRWKFTLIAVLIVLSVLFLLPSVNRNLPSWWKSVLPAEGLKLGLDLQGGMHLILKVDLNKAITNQLDLIQQDLREALRKKQIPASRGETRGFNRVAFILPNADQLPTVREIVKEEFPMISIAGTTPQPAGLQVELALLQKEINSIQENALSQSLEIIRNRIDQFGVTEPVIVRQGADEMVVQLPGVKDPQRAMDLIGKTAQLEFKLVDAETKLDLEGLIEEAVKSGRLKEGYNPADLNQALADKLPPEREIYIRKDVDKETGRVSKKPLLLFSKTLMTGAAIKTASVQFGGNFNEPYVSVSLNAHGTRTFDQVTKDNVGRQLAIILDQVVQSAPVIQERISGGQAQITGAFTPDEAADLAIVLRAGALPAPVQIVQNVTVGPSLGLDSINKGLVSGLVGTALVVLFMIFYYRFSGVVANLALLLNVLFMMAAMSLFRATLTLPGIAGIILSIGMAVDSNVLIFERMREEFHSGKPVKSGVDGGYAKAFWTIIDSHVTTLITAFALFLFGSGPIKGFAVTLSIGVIFNLFTALFCTKVVYDWLSVKRRLKAFRFVEFVKPTKIDFFGFRKPAFLVSGILVLLGLIAFVQINRGEGNLGVEFSGGTMVQFKAQQPFGLEKIRSSLTQRGFKDLDLQQVTQENILIVRAKKSEQTVGKEADAVGRALQEDFPELKFVMESKAEIGASVSSALKKAALIAIAISLAGIILYLAWRFELRFGVAAAIATFHDVLAVLGIFYLLDKEITLLIVTALLTLAGYSLTDTVVIFDRIRETMNRFSRRNFGEIINISVNEVLARSVITGFTVFLVLLALYFLGGVVINDFALALLIGVVVGSYSSIFVAAPLVYYWPGKKARSGRAAAEKGAVVREKVDAEKIEVPAVEKTETAKPAPKGKAGKKKGRK
ncbi:MAG: protein translocase subunit SecD [Desulfobacterota bacterium]|nr:protein translocase subunit SecD [Thermodesulfobacteriota bacterium]